jgi:hypothetical protein
MKNDKKRNVYNMVFVALYSIVLWYYDIQTQLFNTNMVRMENSEVCFNIICIDHLFFPLKSFIYDVPIYLCLPKYN